MSEQWDTATRGPRMSEATGRVIFKYQMPVLEQFTMKLPAGAERGCAYHMGSGMFARFAPWTLDGARRYYDPPNFWFKPANFRVTWYKYIGREMTTNGASPPSDMLEQVFATHPGGMTLDQALAKMAAEEAAVTKSFSRMFTSFGTEMPEVQEPDA